jgi:riboflavin kinase/FMN adenylyltransferase
LTNTRVIALGFFDGVHLGHGALLRQAREQADRLGVGAAVLTFDVHPDTLVFGTEVPLINTAADRTALAEMLYGMDEVLTCHFDRDMMHMPWERFVEQVLAAQYGAVHVVCGHDFRFGDRGAGTAERLKEKCAAMGIGCDIIPKVTLDGVTVSSTHIRKLLAAGDMEAANRFLGHPHRLSGTVCSGRKIGRTLGIPTANIQMPTGILQPAFGVYATKVWIDGAAHPAVTNVGTRPTVGGTHVTVEPWILHFDGDLYGKPVRVEFFRHLRGERKFASLDDLKAEILRNADQTLAYFSEN